MKKYIFIIIVILSVFGACKFSTAKPKIAPVPPGYYEARWESTYLDSSFQYYYDIDLIKPQGISKVDTNQWRTRMMNEKASPMVYMGSFWGIKPLSKSVILICNVRVSLFYKDKPFTFFISRKKVYRRYGKVWLCQNIVEGIENYYHSSHLGKSFISHYRTADSEILNEYYVRYVNRSYKIYQFNGSKHIAQEKVKDTLSITQAHLKQDNRSHTIEPKWVIDFSKGSDTILYYVEDKVQKKRQFTWRNDDKLIHYFNGIEDTGSMFNFANFCEVTR